MGLTKNWSYCLILYTWNLQTSYLNNLKFNENKKVFKTKLVVLRIILLTRTSRTTRIHIANFAATKTSQTFFLAHIMITNGTLHHIAIKLFACAMKLHLAITTHEITTAAMLHACQTTVNMAF